MKAALAATLLILTLSPSVLAQDEEAAPAEEPSGRIEALQEALEGGEPVIEAPPAGTTMPAGAEAGPSTAVLPDIVDPAVLGPGGQESLRAALKAYYDYRVQGFAHRARVFEWQLFSSRLIFALVILIVAVGLYFSWLQFRAGMKEKAGPEATSTTFEASPTGIKLSSPVLGVIILTLSLAFFYLYLVYVYPIEEIL